jgi:hypothetical protein
MPTAVTPKVQLRLGPGAAFGAVLELGSPLNGILGTNILGTTSAQFVDITSNTQQISIRRGRDRVFNQYNTGTAVVRFLDTTGNWNPANTSSPYYNQIKPLRQLIITGSYSGTTYPLFAGYISAWDWEWPDPSANYAIVTITAEDGFRLLSLANVTTVAGATAGELPGARIADILTQISWPATLRALSVGDTTLQADPGTERSALEAIQTVAASDLGDFFMNASGDATFIGRAEASVAAAGTATAFADDGTGIKYQGIDLNLDETDLANVVRFQRAGGTVQTATSSSSVDEYFTRTYDQNDLLMQTDTVALNKATAVLAYRKDPRIRVDSLTLDATAVSNRVIPAVDLKIGDPITVKRRMANSTSLTARLTIQGISHDITPDRWVTQFTTAYPLSVAFILGSSSFGILGTSTL